MKIFVKDVQTSSCLWSKLSPFTQFVSMIGFKVGSCKCGVKKISRNEIIGGNETEVLQLQNKTFVVFGKQYGLNEEYLQNYTQVNEYPWMIVFANETQVGGCGATLVSSLFSVSRGEQRSFIGSNGMVISIFARTIGINGFLMVLGLLNHYL